MLEPAHAGVSQTLTHLKSVRNPASSLRAPAQLPWQRRPMRSAWKKLPSAGCSQRTTSFNVKSGGGSHKCLQKSSGTKECCETGVGVACTDRYRSRQAPAPFPS
eukprot:scaffold10602_cov19-Tisochrysis_lutea.AAC.3